MEVGIGHRKDVGSSTKCDDEIYDAVYNEGSSSSVSSTTIPVQLHRRRRHPLVYYVPRIFQFAKDNVVDGDAPHHPVEATGLALCSIAKGAASMSTIFLGPALLRLARDASISPDGSNCDDEYDDDSTCRVYGMRPTSLLSNIGVFGGLLSCALIPLFGSIVDHTPHRLRVGRMSAFILTSIKGIEVSVGRNTWHVVSALQVANMAVYNAYLVTTYSYTAELSRVPSDQTIYNARFQLLYYASMLTFLISVMTISTSFGMNDVATARVSQILAFSSCAIVFSISWSSFFDPRPASSDVPPGLSIAKSGYNKLMSTVESMRYDRRRRAIRLFLSSASLSEAATSALATISTTYMIHVLDMNASQIGIAFLCVFVAGVPGSKLGGLVGSRWNPLRSALACLFVFVVNTTLAACAIRGPEDRIAMYGFAAVWGVCLAWLHPTHASLYCTIIPKGQEGEFMGLYIFSGSVLAWLPPFLFSFLNEFGASMNIGLASLNAFFVGGFALLYMIGDYDDAVGLAQIEDDSICMASHRCGLDGAASTIIPELT